MNLENQVSSLELSKKLKELGVKQKSLFWWNKTENEEWVLGYVSFVADEFELISAFTVAELGEMLPWNLEKDGKNYFLETNKNGPNCRVAKTYAVNYYDGEEDCIGGFSEDTEANARAKMLVYLLENKLIKPFI